MIAALFVAKNGPYWNLEGVDPWDEARDARKYAGPHPVVAHPPCERWGRYHSGGPSAKVPKLKGQDGGCFYVALWAVRTFGGVLEHPADTAAYPCFGLVPPPKDGGWVAAGDFKGWTCHVEQGHYGHPARKATWLYAVADDLPSLKWGPSGKRTRCDEGFHSKAERARALQVSGPSGGSRSGSSSKRPRPFAKCSCASPGRGDWDDGIRMAAEALARENAGALPRPAPLDCEDRT